VIEINAPAKPDVPVPSEAQLREVFKSAQATAVTPWVDRTQQGPLVPVPPKPGEVTAEKKLPELGVTEWRLANGVRVVLKPTDFRNDQILLAGFSPGGLSLVPDSELTSGQLATTVVAEGGLGDFDAVTLRKAITDKAAFASLGLANFEQTARGAASPRDAETMFQLLYLSFTAPRRDAAAFRSLQARLKATLENRSAQPLTAFADKMQEAVHPGDPRERPLTVERLAELDYDTAFRIYQQRFSDASQFTFFLVGNFTLESIRPLVVTYLGGLPSTGRKETWRPVGGAPPNGVVRVSVAKGEEPKSTVRIVFPGERRYSRETLHELGALRDLLELRLREALRDERGAVYGVGVSFSAEARPSDRHSVTIGFSCAPDQVDALVHVVFEQIAALQERGGTQLDLEKIKESDRREHETNLKKNEFWLLVLVNYYRSGWDPLDILHYDQLLQETTLERMKAAYRQDLGRSRYVLGVLSPAASPPAKQPAGDTKGGSPAPPR
jgi:zinc protease